MATASKQGAGASTAVNDELFKGVCFYLNDSLLPTVRAKLHDLLVASGAAPCLSPPQAAAATGGRAHGSRQPPRFDPAHLTHFITDSLDFVEFDLIQDINGRDARADKKGKGKGKEGHDVATVGSSTDDKVHIVTPAWVTRSYDLQTVQPPRFYSADKKLFFSGTVICTSELPISDTRDIHQAVLTLGGQTRRELTREVTHLICMGESGKKYESAMKYGAELGMQVVLPHWFEESFKHSMLVPTDVYRFPSPPFSTSLRDGTSSKSFADRLFDYWRNRLTASGASTSASTATSPPRAVPSTSTYLILGIPGKGGAMPSGGADRPIDTQQYMHTAGALAQLKRNATVLDESNVPVPDKQLDANYGRFFSGKRIYLASDLSLSLGFEGGLRAQVARAGGSCWSFQYGDDDFPGDEDEDDPVVAAAGKLARDRRSGTNDSADAWETRRRAEKRLKESDIVIMQVREGWEYWTAYENSLSIGNLQYFYDCMAHSTLLSPLARLCYYPVPSVTGLPDWPQRDRGTPPVMTVSNYAAEARDYVRTLIELLGARFEGTMTKSTDYVVSATENGSKVSHAREWHIPLVTHLWLEALILDWRYIPPTADPSYLLTSSSSHGTHYAAILGDTSYTRDVIRRWTQREDVKAARNEAMQPIEELAKADMPELAEAENGLPEPDDVMQVEPKAPPPEPPKGASPAPIAVPAAVPPPSKKETAEARRTKSRTETPQAADEAGVEVAKDAATAKEAEKAVDPNAMVTPNRRNGKAPLAGKRKRERSPSTLSSASSSSSSDDLPPSANKMTKAFALISNENLVQGSSRRGAAAKAQAALIDQIKDRNAFEKELKSSGRKKGGVARRSRSPSKKMTQEGEEDVKDEDVEMSDGEGGDEQDEPEPVVAKKGKGKAASKAKPAARPSTESDAAEPVKDAAPPARKKVKTAAKAPPANKQLKSVQASGNGTTQASGVISSFDRPPHAKPAKKSDKPKKVKIISTGLGLDKDHDDIRNLKPFGATWTESSKDATHLVVKGISRTEKFLCCLPYTPKIVTPAWITACLAAGRLVDETPYLLKDVKKEKEINDTLEAILERARQRKLYDGYNIYVTKHIQPDTSVMQRIITAGGGTVHTTLLSKLKQKVIDDPRALIVSCEQDKREWQGLAAAPHHCKIYSVEAILQATLHQDIARGFIEDNRIDARWEE
ncbi:hypothetical protein JCM10908_007202 [Rhodotorula pacifica]|uniref:uncharacterized protein n=1 Tax=Rhodotorula pacifica TaxID=1495444 RepID=UPI003176B49D